MAGINFDATQVSPNAGFSAVEKGKYPVVISQSEFKPTSNGAGKILELHCRINGGPNNGRDIMINLNWENASVKAVEIGKGRFSAICYAVNVLHVQDTRQIHDIPFMLEVDVTPDGKYNEVVAIAPIAQGQPVQQFAPQPVQQVAQQYQRPVQQYQQPVTQPVQQFAPQGKANPMAAYEQMTQGQPVQQFAPQPVQQVAQGQAEVPDWIKNQQLAAQQAGQAPMGNG